jgi:predicted ATPase
MFCDLADSTRLSSQLDPEDLREVIRVEDLHWIDPSTLELLTRLIEQEATARILTLLTCRPEFQPPWPLRSKRLAQARSLWGWALAAQGQGAEGVAQMQQGLAAWRATGAEVGRPHVLVLLAQAYMQAGQPEARLAVLARTLSAIQQTGVRVYEVELHRLNGGLLHAERGRSQSPCATAWVQRSFPPPTQSRRAQNAALTAEECFQQALEVARRQQAKSLELHTAVSLARLWQRLGKRDAARELLAPMVHRGF